VALVSQQAEFFACDTGLNVGSYCGADGVDGWSRSKWEEEVATNQVLVMVHQVFLDLLLRGYFHFDLVNLLIFDEVHHTTKNHPYMQVN